MACARWAGTPKLGALALPSPRGYTPSPCALTLGPVAGVVRLIEGHTMAFTYQPYTHRSALLRATCAALTLVGPVPPGNLAEGLRLGARALSVHTSRARRASVEPPGPRKQPCLGSGWQGGVASQFALCMLTAYGLSRSLHTNWLHVFSHMHAYANCVCTYTYILTYAHTLCIIHGY